MAWYSKIFGRPTNNVPSVSGITVNTIEGPKQSGVINHISAYEQIEIVNRAVNMIVDDCSLLDVNIGNKTQGVVKGMKVVTLNNLLNTCPNPYQDVSDFRRRIFTDYLLQGNIFIYYDGVHLYHLPAEHMTVKGSKEEYIEEFVYREGVLADSMKYGPNEVIHIRENNLSSDKFVGVSRLKSQTASMNTLLKMKKFQENFFKNNAIPGLVITTENTLSDRIRSSILERWQKIYKPEEGGKRPLLLDGGFKVDRLSNFNFRELDFQQGQLFLEEAILRGIGVPPVLLNSGNNANLRPNMRLYYLETILPIENKLLSGFSRFFGYRLRSDVSEVPALQPELQEAANYYSALVNGGIITP